MGGQDPKTEKKSICIGLLAHVDAGKTTLSEGMLYLSGVLRTLGRVDHRDAFLDTDAMERERGITIFSKQARLSYKNVDMTLLDTPGHVDFSAEMERTLQVLDYAILVIGGSDGVQGHTETVWRLLKRYRIPVFLFINKMDLQGNDRQTLLAQLSDRLSDNCVDFGGERDQDFYETAAMCDEAAMEACLENGSLTDGQLAVLIAARELFPCYFGSALKLTGVEAFLDGLAAYTLHRRWPEAFGARVYKIARDGQGSRLTYMRITGGSLRVKMPLSNRGSKGKNGHALAEGELWEEKIDQIRLYSGEKYQTVEEVPAGTVCAVTGLSRTFPGEGLGAEVETALPVLEPVLTYKILLPEDCDIHKMLADLRQLEEEDPQLHIVWQERLQEIHVQLMGAVQLEILQRVILDRFGIKVGFGTGNIVYKETIEAPVEGVGHFEPLRHYAEVHLLLEPGERGSGLTFAADCSEDVLDLNWQRLILTHLEESEHPGVLTGAPVTDMRITVLTGRAHIKHTEGGDFRQATYRAVRQGLMQAKSVLLEPWYDFRLDLPREQVGRAMADVQRMGGTVCPPDIAGETAVLAGSAPVAGMSGYMEEVSAYTRGRGRLFCTMKGYEPCHNADEVIAATGYDPEADTENPPDSVFCSHGAGTIVKWDRVREYMHVDSGWKPEGEKKEEERIPEVRGAARPAGGSSYYGSWKEDRELEEIFRRTFGEQKKRAISSYSEVSYGRTKPAAEPSYTYRPPKEPIKEYLLVDGY
ncbi:MAG TPA: translation elongation factor G, partial [Lachnospiraceae bacterium]|nr:translation elongation factor G [Lachnospiraceae bacterium]